MRILPLLMGVLAHWAGPSAFQQSPPLVPRPALKLIVEHPVLAPYLHPETPGRVPLVVSWSSTRSKACRQSSTWGV